MQMGYPINVILTAPIIMTQALMETVTATELQISMTRIPPNMTLMLMKLIMTATQYPTAKMKPQDSEY